MRTQVFLTIDTESSIGGGWSYPERRPLPASHRIFCRNESGSYGIPLIVEEFRRYGMRGTFFCEMLATLVLGEPDTRSCVDFLLEADQDVQLHVHPTFRHYHDYLESGDPAQRRKKAALPDQMSLYTENEQVDFLEEAVGILRRCTGTAPAAFRAGGYAANQATLRALRRVSIPIDTSYNPAYRWNHSFAQFPLEINRVQKVEGIWEFPVTVAKTGIPEGGGWKPLEISAISNWEMEKILTTLHAHDVEHAVIMFHSFSAVKEKDPFYSAFRPNHVVIRRLKRLLRFLADHSDRFCVTTFGEVARKLPSLDTTHKAVIPDLGVFHPAARKLVQGVNRLYWL